MTRLPCLMCCAMAVAAATLVTDAQTQTTPRALQTIEDGALDQIRIYAELPPASTVRIAVKPFTATDRDLVDGGQKDELPADTKTVQASGPGLLQDTLVKTLVDRNAFAAVTKVEGRTPPPAGALVLEGHFTTIDPGNQDKRRTIGFGAGKSIVAVAGTVRAADGSVMATFEHRRIGVVGTNSLKKLTEDASGIGEDIANFLTAWGTGKKLK